MPHIVTYTDSSNAFVIWIFHMARQPFTHRIISEALNLGVCDQFSERKPLGALGPALQSSDAVSAWHSSCMSAITSPLTLRGRRSWPSAYLPALQCFMLTHLTAVFSPFPGHFKISMIGFSANLLHFISSFLCKAGSEWPLSKTACRKPRDQTVSSS